MKGGLASPFIGPGKGPGYRQREGGEVRVVFSQCAGLHRPWGSLLVDDVGGVEVFHSISLSHFVGKLMRMLALIGSSFLSCAIPTPSEESLKMLSDFACFLFPSWEERNNGFIQLQELP